MSCVRRIFFRERNLLVLLLEVIYSSEKTHDPLSIQWNITISTQFSDHAVYTLTKGHKEARGHNMIRSVATKPDAGLQQLKPPSSLGGLI